MEEYGTLVDPAGESLWDKFKKQLDEELVPDQVSKMRYLMKDKINQINGDAFEDLKTPSDLLTFLENNMADDEAWIVVEHVFTITKEYFHFEESSIAAIVNKYRQTRARFTCSTFIGRQNEVSTILRYFKDNDYIGVWIHGFGGIGKTSLAREVCATLSSDMEVIYMDMKQVTSALDLARQILMFVVKVVNEHSSDIDTLVEMITLPADSNYCILLDNIETVYCNNHTDTIKVLNKCMISSSYTIKWIITCRLPPDGGLHESKLDRRVAVFELSPLGSVYSKKLLKLRAKPKKVPSNLVESILKKTNGNPLAIELIGSAMKECIRDNSTSFIIQNILYTGKMEEILKFTHDSLNDSTQRQLLELSVVGASEFDINIASAILKTNFDKTVMLMMELTNRHVIQRVKWNSIRKRETKSQVELEYCLHPLILRYLENKHTYDNVHQAQQNFCIHMFDQIEEIVKDTGGFDVNFQLVRRILVENEGVYKSLFNVLSNQLFTQTSPITTNRSHYLGKVAEIVQLSSDDKNKLYANVIENSSEDTALNMYWRVEQFASLVDEKQLLDAQAMVCDIEQVLGKCADRFILGSFWYHKGRYWRLKKHFQEAIKCLEKAIEDFKRCGHTAGVAQSQNAMGNVYFDNIEFDKSKEAHEKARDTLKSLAITDHPDLSTYDFNIGTVCMAIADQKRKLFNTVGEEAIDYYTKALQMFRESLTRDMALGMNKSSQYAIKLENTACCQYFLGQFDEAISSISECMKVSVLPVPNRRTVTAYFRAGKLFMDWYIPDRSNLTQERKQRLKKEAETCFIQVKDILTEHPLVDLSDEDKTSYILYCNKLFENYPKDRRISMESFCQRYEACRLHCSDSSTSSSHSSSPSNDSTRTDSLSDEAMAHSDGSTNEQYTGISFSQNEKIESAQFERNLFHETGSNLPSSSKRPCSSSDTD